MKSPFIITPRIIAHLGEDLIKNESIALIELVKNAYDANAHNCSVNFLFSENDILERITIRDDGCGMSMDTIKNVWLVIGTNYKQNIIKNKSFTGRMPLGEKGIGRLGVHKLGRKISLFTKAKNGTEVDVSINWADLINCTKMDDFEINIEENKISSHFNKNETGTIIQIESLKGDWDRRKLRSVYRDLTSLNSPFSNRNDNFKVSIQSNNDVFQGLPDVNQILEVGMYHAHCTIEGNCIESFRYEFRPWDTLKRIESRTVTYLDDIDSKLIKKVENYSNSGRRFVKEAPLDLSIYKIGKITIDIVIFERDISVFSYMNMEKRSLNSYLRDNGGIRVYRDDMRVYNYGEQDNDWLGLDANRINRAGGSISNNLVIGSVSINRAESEDLKEKTNREGFIENDAYFAFVDAIKYAIDRILQFRNEDKFRLVSIYKNSSKMAEPVMGDLGEVINLIDKVVPNEADKANIKSLLVRVEQQYKEVRDTLIKSANAGLNLGIAVHELGKQVASLKGFAERGEVDKIKDITSRLEKTVAGYSVFLSNSKLEKTDVSSIVKIVVNNNIFRFRAHKIKVYSNYKSFKGNALMSKAETIASLTNLIDNSIYWVSRNHDDDTGAIYIYLTGEIKGYITIAVCDNGPGFKIPPSMAVQPFVTGKPMNAGMGLGLHVTNEVMKAMNGKLLIMDAYDLQLPKHFLQISKTPTVVALAFKLDECKGKKS